MKLEKMYLDGAKNSPTDETDGAENRLKSAPFFGKKMGKIRLGETCPLGRYFALRLI